MAVGSREPFRALPQLSLEGRAPSGEAFARRWKALHRHEQQWIRQAAYRARRAEEPELRELVAGFAWRELGRLGWGALAGAIGMVALQVAMYLASGGALALTGAGGAIVIAGMLWTARRLAVALALNIGPPRP
jgi:hypothetical protein